MNDKIKGRPIRLNKRTLIPKDGCVNVMFISDVHYGSPQCDVQRFLGNLKWCVDHYYYIFLMGDLTETATRSSVGAGVYEQEEIADAQHEQLVEWLRPAVNHGLILGTHRGNHESRVFDSCGFDPSKALARELKIPYLRDACWSVFRVGKQIYTLYTLHGRSGAKFDGTALLALERLSAPFFADIVACGHSHKCVNDITMMQKVSHDQVVEHKKHLIICGAYLKYDGGYGQTIGLPIPKLGSPRVKFFADRHDLVVSW